MPKIPPTHSKKSDSSKPPISSLRQDYQHGILRRSALEADPMKQFDLWFHEASACKMIIEPNAMVLSTASKNLEVSSRTVLLKEYDADGFHFFTNIKSLKGKQISENPRVALLFYWAPLERQIKIQGVASLLSRPLTEKYFRSRPRASQLGAWASSQSDILQNRKELEDQASELEKNFADMEIPLPDFWSGYLVEPYSIEFWQGRSNRLHDRFRYKKNTASEWVIERLSP
ncbi:MAG: pyridoxamine 5'-phosphate oxidase [Chthoniobacterales bacterium]